MLRPSGFAEAAVQLASAAVLIIRGSVERAGEVANLSTEHLRHLCLAARNRSRDFIQPRRLSGPAPTVRGKATAATRWPSYLRRV